MKTILIELYVPRAQVELFTDLMDLNGYGCEVEAQEGRPSIVRCNVSEQRAEKEEEPRLAATAS